MGTVSQSFWPKAGRITITLVCALLVRLLIDLELTFRARRLHLLFPGVLHVWGGLLAASAPNSMRSETFLSAQATESSLAPAGRLAAMAPLQSWFGKNLWHVSCRPPQAMIHGVMEQCFIPGPRGHLVGGLPISLHDRQLPLALAPMLFVLDTICSRSQTSLRDWAVAFLLEA